MIENDEVTLKRYAHRSRIDAYATCGCEGEVDHMECLDVSFLCERCDCVKQLYLCRKRDHHERIHNIEVFTLLWQQESH